jgi:hypothetical protein
VTQLALRPVLRCDCCHDCILNYLCFSTVTTVGNDRATVGNDEVTDQ